MEDNGSFAKRGGNLSRVQCPVSRVKKQCKSLRHGTRDIGHATNLLGISTSFHNPPTTSTRLLEPIPTRSYHPAPLEEDPHARSRRHPPPRSGHRLRRRHG